MKTILEWLRDINTKNGYVGVLIALVVIVALVLIVAKVGGVDLSSVAAWLGSVGG